MPETIGDASGPKSEMRFLPWAPPRKDAPADKVPSGLGRYCDRLIPEAAFADADLLRRGRLVARFGFLGLFFGLLYAGFYSFIGHWWGVAVVIACSLLYGATPLMMKRTGSIAFGGNFLIAVMALGFTALCMVEAGINGHAIAWLACVPLCALLVTGEAAARRWVFLCLLSTALFVALELQGVHLAPAYELRWHAVVSSCGYLGLVAFMFLLGVIFERSRHRAMQQLEAALGELKDSNAQLKALNSEKDELMGIAAHDLKNPLTAVIGNAELLMLARDASKVQLYAGRISTAGARMLHLVKSLLDANALEHGLFTIKFESCDMVSLVDQSLEHNRTAAQAKQTQLRFQTGGELVARGDRSATVQILDNLVSNAIKYSPPNSTVEIRLVDLGEGVAVEVQDQGPGISAEDQKKLFQKFVRLSAQPTAGESSTGLGLSIVKRLAHQMGGEVGCRSVLGAGATFYLQLPKLRSESAPTRAPLLPVD